MEEHDFKTIEKKSLKALLADDKLEQLQENLRDITLVVANKDILNEVILNAGRLSDYRKTLTMGTASSEDLRTLRNQIRLSFLNIIDELPDEVGTQNPASLPISKKIWIQHNFKSWIFAFMLIGKLLLMAFIVFQIDTGGFTQEQGLSVITLLLPVLTAYLGAMVADIVKRKNDLFPTDNDNKPISKMMQRATFVLLPLYFLFIYLLISRYAIGYMQQNDGEADFKSLTTWLGVIESGFGVYVGQIVYGLFREK